MPPKVPELEPKVPHQCPNLGLIAVQPSVLAACGFLPCCGMRELLPPPPPEPQPSTAPPSTPTPATTRSGRVTLASLRMGL